MMTLHDKSSEVNGQRSARRRAFSLVEVLLAIFILGVGVISIAALFPAGIAQQRLSVDEIMGPTVANNAIALIRTKVRAIDFAWHFAPGHQSVQGDWPWARPAFYGIDTNVSPAESSINLFINADTDTELPYNTDIWTSGPPEVNFTLGERCYPMMPLENRDDPTQGFSAGVDGHSPQYIWTPMFRRFQGKMYVAIFVYRVSGTSSMMYKPTQALPYMKILQGDATHPGGPWAAGAGSSTNPINGSTGGGMAYNPDNPDQAWQEPRQWLLDQNLNVHRVAASYRENDSLSSPVRVELVRPVAPLTGAKAYYPSSANGAPVTTGVVQRLWFMPLRDGEFTLTPVYLTVKEL